MRMKRKWLLIIGAVVIVLLGITLSTMLPKEGAPRDVPSCGQSNTLFNHYLVDPELLFTIVPLGNLNPSGHTFPVRHMYFNVGYNSPSGEQMDVPKVSVYAPGDLYVDSISKMCYSYKDTCDYSVSFWVCDEVSGYFIHLVELAGSLAEAYYESGVDCSTQEIGGGEITNCFEDVDVKVEAGEKIGMMGGSLDSTGMDFGLQDARTEPAYVAGLEHRADGFEYTVCPLDYYSDEKRARMELLLGDMRAEEQRAIEPVCGTPHQDIEGTAQGVWYSEEHLGGGGHDETYHMALVHDNTDPRKGAMSVGKSLGEIGIDADVYYFDPKSGGRVNRDFYGVVADGEVYCYEFMREGMPSGGENMNAWHVLIAMPDDRTLWIANGGEGRCDGRYSSIGSEYVEFVR